MTTATATADFARQVVACMSADDKDTFNCAAWREGITLQIASSSDDGYEDVDPDELLGEIVDLLRAEDKAITAAELRLGAHEATSSEWHVHCPHEEPAQVYAYTRGELAMIGALILDGADDGAIHDAQEALARPLGHGEEVGACAACPECRCSCGCDERATTTDDAGEPSCDACTDYYVTDDGDAVCSREQDDQECRHCGEAISWSGILTGVPGQSNWREGTCGCRSWRQTENGGAWDLTEGEAIP